MLGLLLMIAAAVPGWYALRDHRAVDEYRAAPMCSESTPDDNAGCRRLVPATLAAVHRSSVGHTVILHIDKPAPVAGAYRLPTEAAVVTGAAAGDPVTAELWHGKVVALARYGQRSATANAPSGHEALSLALLLGLAGLAVLTKFVLRTRFPASLATRRLDFSDWRADVYGAVVLLPLSALVTWWTEVEQKPLFGNPLLSTLVLYAIVGPLLVLANLSYLRSERTAARRVAAGLPALRPPRRLLPRLPLGERSLGLAVLALGGCLAAGAVTTAFVTSAYLAAGRAAVSQPLCAPGHSAGCLQQRDATVLAVDPDSRRPDALVQGPVIGTTYVYFPTAQRGFVRSMSYGQLLSLGVSGDRIVTVSVVGQPAVAGTDLSLRVPVEVEITGAVVAMILLMLGIRLRWPRLRSRRVWTEAGGVLVLGVAAWAGVVGRAWWPYGVAAALLLVLVTVPSWRQPADRVVPEG